MVFHGEQRNISGAGSQEMKEKTEGERRKQLAASPSATSQCVEEHGGHGEGGQETGTGCDWIHSRNQCVYKGEMALTRNWERAGTC